MTSDDERRAPDPAEVTARLMQMFVFAPLDSGLRLITDGPGTARRVRQELSNARFIGRLVVDTAAARLKAQIEDAAETDLDGHGDADGALDDSSVVVTDEADDRSSVAVDSLALPDYEHLPAIDIVAQLPSLTAAERARIDEYERAHRGRRTVLGKIAQLTEASR